MLPSIDIYKIFNLPKSFHIDKNVLKNEYYKLNKKYHPDILKNEDNKIKEINIAYKILQDDYLRAKYLHEKPIEQKMNQDFLVEVLDLEERINDNLDNQKELIKLKDFLHTKIQECINKYKNPFYLGKWGYYRRLVKEVSKMII